MEVVALAKYRQVGGRLGAYIRANNPSTQQIQGLLADLLAGDPLLPTMREVVTMPGFAALKDLAGSGGGAVQRDAVLQELAGRYLPGVVDHARQLINGFLDQPAGATSYSNEKSVRPKDGNDSLTPIIDTSIRELEPIGVDWDFTSRYSHCKDEDKYYEQTSVASKKDYAYSEDQSWFSPAESWKDQEREVFTSFSSVNSEGRYIGEISSILKAPTGLVVQWCNKTKLRGREWIGPDTYLDNDECFFVLENYKASGNPFRLVLSVLVSCLVYALVACFIAVLIALVIAWL